MHAKRLCNWAHLSTGCEVGKTSTPTQQNWAKTSAA